MNKLLLAFVGGKGPQASFRNNIERFFVVERRLLSPDDADGIVGVVRMTNRYFTTLVEVVTDSLDPQVNSDYFTESQGIVLFVDAISAIDEATGELARLRTAIRRVDQTVDAPVPCEDRNFEREKVLLVVLYNAQTHDEIGDEAEEKVLSAIYDRPDANRSELSPVRFGLERIGRITEDQKDGWNSVMDSLQCAPWPETLDKDGDSESSTDEGGSSHDGELQVLEHEFTILSIDRRSGDHPKRIHQIDKLLCRLDQSSSDGEE